MKQWNAAEIEVSITEITSTDEADTDPKVQQALDDRTNSPKISFIRNSGQLKTITTVGKDLLVTAGAIGEVVGFAFVILDFVNKQWVAGALGLVGLAAVGIAAAASNPVGWVIGGAIALLCASKCEMVEATHGFEAILIKYTQSFQALESLW